MNDERWKMNGSNDSVINNCRLLLCYCKISTRFLVILNDLRNIHQFIQPLKLEELEELENVECHKLLLKRFVANIIVVKEVNINRSIFETKNKFIRSLKSIIIISIRLLTPIYFVWAEPSSEFEEQAENNDFHFVSFWFYFDFTRWWRSRDWIYEEKIRLMSTWTESRS